MRCGRDSKRELVKEDERLVRASTEKWPLLLRTGRRVSCDWLLRMGDETPKTIGPWLRGPKLGEGGNATVWSATRPGNATPVALKVLHATHVDKEPYRRFIREVAFLQKLGDTTGILPLLDAYLPENPTAEDRAWLAMPIATPINQALAGQPLNAVVAAIEEIALTLTRLKASYGVAHRDIKPENVYVVDSRPLVGDFGIIHLPDMAELTRHDRPLGPAHFTAYELVRDPANADPHPADVYSLSKTLWVLATEQRFPPDGHQAASDRRFTIEELRPHPNADALDRLIDGMTRTDPVARPSMEQVSRDLAAWQLLSNESSVPDVSELAARFRAKNEAELAASDLLGRRMSQIEETVERFRRLCSPINDALGVIGGYLEIDAVDDKLTNNTLRTRDYIGAPVIPFRWQRCTRLMPSPQRRNLQLRASRAVEMTEAGEAIVRTLVTVGRVDVLDVPYMWQPPERRAAVGSVELERLVQESAAELLAQIGPAIEVFVERA